MKRIIFKYGLIASAMIAVLMPAISWNDQVMRSDYAALIGYTILILTFSTIFLAVGKYSETTSDGKVSFGKALLIGLGISMMATIVYAIAWGLIDGFSGGDFINTYADQMVAELKESGASEEEIIDMEQQMEAYKKWNENPVYKMLLTMSEILPVGLMVSLITAFAFRFKKKKHEN